jgi:hypothetical protein
MESRETEYTPVATVTGLYRGTYSGLELLTEDFPLTLDEVRGNPIIYELELHPESQNDDLIVDVIYDNMEPIRLPDLIRGTDFPRGIPVWLDWFEIPPYRETHDMMGRRVYPRAAGYHTVRIRTAKRKREQKGNRRDFSPANGGSTSPVFTFAIMAESRGSSDMREENAEGQTDPKLEKTSCLRPNASAFFDGEL